MEICALFVNTAWYRAEFTRLTSRCAVAWTSLLAGVRSHKNRCVWSLAFPGWLTAREPNGSQRCFRLRISSHLSVGLPRAYFRDVPQEFERDAKETKTMKTKWNSLLLTAALTVSAAAAYGQNRVIANVPFSFWTIAGVQAAGQYGISQIGAATMLQNLETRKASFLGIGAEGVNAGKPPKLEFTCGSESGCALTSVQLADGHGWRYKAPRLKPNEVEHFAVINLESKQDE